MSERIFRAEIVPWVEPPGHFGGYSKYLVGPDGHGSQHFDFRISSYQPKGYVEPHVHQVAEHVYYILRGTGLAVVGGEQRLVEPNVTIFVPPGVEHAIYNTGFEDLVFIVATSPPGDILR